MGDSDARSSIGSAFITGRPKRVRTATTRSGVSLPCNCSMSGCSASTISPSISSVALTVSAHFAGAALHPLAQRARGRIAEVARRGRKEDETDLIGPRIQRHVERLGGLQATDFHQKSHVFRIHADRAGF
jgi:hypothetical protein